MHCSEELYTLIQKIRVHKGTVALWFFLVRRETLARSIQPPATNQQLLYQNQTYLFT